MKITIVLLASVLAVLASGAVAEQGAVPPPSSREADFDGVGPGRGPGSGHRRQGREPGRPELSEQRMEELLGLLEREQPDMHGRLLELRQSRPGAFRRSMERIDQFVREMESLPPELRALRQQQNRQRMILMKLVSQHRQLAADSPGRAELRGQVVQAVERLFEAEHALRAHRVEQLRRRLEVLSDELADRAARKQQLIDLQVRQLLQGLGEEI